MKKIILYFLGFIVLFCAGFKTQAQFNYPENNVWAFGNQAGMKFAGPNPISVTTSMYSGEGCASVCNQNGELLFYSNGNKIWGANGNLFPHGQDLDISATSAFTTTQTALIVSIPWQANKFYLFTLGSTLFCYKIDMSLNNGFGDVDTTFSLTHVPLRDSLTEKMIAIPGCNQNAWVIVKSKYSNQFFSYNITDQGVDTTAIVSSGGFSAPADYIQRTMCASVDGHKIVVNTITKLELLNFDIVNGKVSNGKVVDNQSYYGACFSSNGKYLYTNNGDIYQYDLTACDPAATKINVGNSFFGDIRLAANGKIYFRSGFGGINGYNFLGSIEYPNVGGAGCQFRDSVTGTAMLIVDPTSPATSSLGFPNTVIRLSLGEKPLNRSYFDTCICEFPYTAGLNLTAAPGFSNYQWGNGSTTTTINVHQRGTYWVNYQTSCGRRTDTFSIRGTIDPVTLTYSAPLISTSGVYQSYTWYKDGTLLTGAVGSTFEPTISGIYAVVVTNAQGCTDSAFININVTGINEAYKDLKVLIYPNPATDVIYIESDIALQSTVFDLSGRTLLTTKRSKTIDVSMLKAGIYFIKLVNDNSDIVAIKKVVKTGQ
jgi:hypothetical protein